MFLTAEPLKIKFQLDGGGGALGLWMSLPLPPPLFQLHPISLSPLHDSQGTPRGATSALPGSLGAAWASVGSCWLGGIREAALLACGAPHFSGLDP